MIEHLLAGFDHERMESQSISQDGYLLRCKAADSSHGASVKSRLAISGSGACCCCRDELPLLLLRLRQPILHPQQLHDDAHAWS